MSSLYDRAEGMVLAVPLLPLAMLSGRFTCARLTVFMCLRVHVFVRSMSDDGVDVGVLVRFT